VKLGVFGHPVTNHRSSHGRKDFRVNLDRTGDEQLLMHNGISWVRRRHVNARMGADGPSTVAKCTLLVKKGAGIFDLTLSVEQV
jgi:hypothetical protein